MKQIKVRHIGKREAYALHDQPRFKQRNVKRLPIERDQDIIAADQLSDGAEHGRLFAVIAHDILADDHRRAFDIAHANFKGDRPRATAEAGCFSIQKQQLMHVPTLSDKVRVARPNLLKRCFLDSA